MNKHLTRFFNYFFLILVTFLVISNLFMVSEPYFQQGVDYTQLVKPSLIIFGYSLLILGLVFLLKKVNLAKKYTLVLIMFFSLLLKLFWVNNFSVDYYYDMSSVFTFAADIFTKPDYLPLVGFHYLKVYSFNIPLVLLDLLYYNLVGYKNAYLLAQAVNIGCVLLIEWGIFLIVKLLKNEALAYRSLILTILFFPFLGFIAITYNDLNSCMLFLYAVYFILRYQKTTLKKYLFLSIVFLVLGNVLRAIGIIFVIAITLDFLRKNLKQAVIYVLLTFSLIFIVNQGLTFTYQQMGILNAKEENMQIPVTHYLAIGSSNGVNGKTPGYYKAYLNEYYFTDQKYNQTEFKQISLENLQTNLEALTGFKLVEHYGQKFQMQWLDGTFETALVNDFIDNKEDSPVTYHHKTAFFDYLTKNAHLYNIIINYSQGYWFLVLASIAFISLMSKKDDDQLVLLKIIIMGIMGFYVLWEISPHYSFVALPYFIIIFSLATDDIAERIKQLYEKIKQK